MTKTNLLGPFLAHEGISILSVCDVKCCSNTLSFARENLLELYALYSTMWCTRFCSRPKCPNRLFHVTSFGCKSHGVTIVSVRCNPTFVLLLVTVSCGYAGRRQLRPYLEGMRTGTIWETLTSSTSSNMKEMEPRLVTTNVLPRALNIPPHRSSITSCALTLCDPAKQPHGRRFQALGTRESADGC
jgi:hypothetical protein